MVLTSSLPTQTPPPPPPTTFLEFHVAAVALTPLTTHPQTQAKLVRSPVRGQEREQPGVVATILITISFILPRIPD